MTARTGRTVLLVVGFFALATAPSTARAQGNQFNPYGNSGYADYRDYGSTQYSGNSTEPGQSRIDDTPLISRPRANSYQQYSDELDGSDTGMTRRGSSSNMPYYMAYQQLNSKYNRVYRPNAATDQKFSDRSRQRDAAYAKALRETDPAKRAKLLREVDQLSLDGSRSAARPRSAAGASALRANSSPAIPPAPSPYATREPLPLGNRRAPAVTSPNTSNAARQPSTTAPTTRAPAPSATAPTATAPRPDATSPAPTDPSSVPIPPPPR